MSKIRKNMKRPAVFLDRDGTIIADKQYLSHASEIKLFSHTPAALRLLKKAGFYLFVVSNQSGVARGYFPESGVQEVHRKLQQMLKARGASIDAFFYCPHYPKGKVKAYQKICPCRKPGIGMIQQAARKFKIDLQRSYAIGDKMDDLLMARKARLAWGLLVRTGKGRKSEKKLRSNPLPKSTVFSDILDAAKWISSRI